MADRLSPQDRDRCARLKALRLYHHHTTQTAFAKKLKISLSRWNNVEKAGFPVSKEIEDKLVAATPGLSVDWIRHGNWNGVSGGLRVELERLLHDLQKGREAAL